MFASSHHLELPGVRSSNPWLQAFAWIRKNTPTDAYFTMDPNYLAAPGEDYHSFRALAERSQLADAIKDTAVVTQVPELGPTWERQVAAQAGWDALYAGGFRAAEIGVRRELGAGRSSARGASMPLAQRHAFRLPDSLSLLPRNHRSRNFAR